MSAEAVALLPQNLQEQTLSLLEQWQQALVDAELSSPKISTELQQQLSKVFAASRFVAKQFTQNPAMAVELLSSGELHQDYSQQIYVQQLTELCQSHNDDDQLMAALRQYRQRAMCRIIWRNVNGLAPMQDIVAELSYLAEACVAVAADWLYAKLSADYGTPIGDESGEPQKLVVLGMGKLGAWELNLSSDIDLIFTYPENGETVGGRRTLANKDFFIRLGKQLIKLLDVITPDGFVFRVDMRLRPYGQSGALAVSFGAMEDYCLEQGREWERYAMVKARVIAGEPTAGEQLQQLLKPFIYRRYIDFSAFDSLRDMKAMINREVQRRQLADDVKLGSGGIREVEFIAQAFQLIRGGRDEALQERRLLTVLQSLAEQECLPQVVVDELTQAYIFLRNVEHAIQGLDDAQTQQLPSDPNDRLIVAMVLGFDDWDSFLIELTRHRDNVARHFADVITPVENEDAVVVEDNEWQFLWAGELEQEQAEQFLKTAGYDSAADSYRRISSLRESRKVTSMQREGRERLDRFMPIILEEIAAKEQPSLVLERVLELVESVARRTAYLMLLLENVEAREQLLILCEASPWISQQLTRHPALLDELVNTASLYAVPERQALQQDLRQQVLRLEWDDLEGHMEVLRYYRAAHILRIAASEVTGRMPLMKVSDYLTYLAEAILEHVVELCWQNLIVKHGRPLRKDGTPCDKDFLIVAYGKLGGIELGHGSDLDLVFIHDADPASSTDGNKPLVTQLFFNRLGQRIIHVLSTATVSGELYEVDMRLRPSGESGLLVTSLSAFVQYQQKNAWTWEHQALVRARAVAGDPALAEKFEQVRCEILQQQREHNTLLTDVVSMRKKMTDNLLPKAAEQGDTPYFDLKQGSGGIVDIEFMVQFAVLAWAHQYPSLTRYSDNIRILEAMAACQLLTDEQVQGLMAAYKAYRSLSHRLALQQKPKQASIEMFANERETVRDVWQQFMNTLS